LAVPGQTYQIQYKTNLSQPAWIGLANFTASNTNGLFLTCTTNGPQQFYRVVAQ
jgi:hypothetical protein